MSQERRASKSPIVSKVASPRKVFIFIRRIGFLFNNNVRMREHKVLVIKRDMPDDAEPIGDNAKLEDIAKCPLI